MPAWLIQFIMEQLTKFLTPELVKKLEDAAKQFVCCELQKFAATTATDIDDVIVAKVALALEVDLSKCPV